MATRYRVSCTECPFERTYTSRAKADWAFGKHSCARHNRAAELRARGEARKAAVDRTPKPCLHKEAQHQHGTYACYVLDFCRCLPCSRANSDYEANRVRQQAYGRWNGLVDAEPARQHIRALMNQGMGLKRIVIVSGVSHGVLWKLIYGKPGRNGNATPSKRIRPHTEQRILAVQLDRADGARIDSTGAVRRVRALVALGWSQSKIAARLGILRSNFTPISDGSRPFITVAYDKAIRELYGEWSKVLPPSGTHRERISVNRSKNYAEARGWLPPELWDDDALDDPNAVPITDVGDDVDEAAIQRRMAGDSVPLTPAEQAEVVRRLLDAGVAKNEIERRTGLNPYRVSHERRAS